MRTVRPLGDTVYVVKDKGPEKIGRIIVPEVYRDKQRDTYHRAVVKAVGPGRWATCPKCFFGYSFSALPPIDLNPSGIWAIEVALSPHAFNRGLFFTYIKGPLSRALDKAREEFRGILETTPNCTPNCAHCGGTALIRVKKVVVHVGDVVYVNENVTGKRLDNPVALGLEEQLGSRPVLVIPSIACALFEEPQLALPL